MNIFAPLYAIRVKFDMNENTLPNDVFVEMVQFTDTLNVSARARMLSTGYLNQHASQVVIPAREQIIRQFFKKKKENWSCILFKNENWSCIKIK